MSVAVNAGSVVSSDRGRKAIYAVTTVIAVIAFLVPGAANLAHAEHIASDMAHLGYPPYFLTILGAWKVLGALAIALPRRPLLKEWAYAGMIFDLSGAAISRTFAGDGAVMALVPTLIAVVVCLSWATRPADRRLVVSPLAMKETP